MLSVDTVSVRNSVVAARNAPIDGIALKSRVSAVRRKMAALAQETDMSIRRHAIRHPGSLAVPRDRFA